MTRGARGRPPRAAPSLPRGPPRGVSEGASRSPPGVRHAEGRGRNKRSKRGSRVAPRSSHTQTRHEQVTAPPPPRLPRFPCRSRRRRLPRCAGLLLQLRGEDEIEHRAGEGEGEGVRPINLAVVFNLASRSGKAELKKTRQGGGGARGYAQAQNNRQGIYCRHLLRPPLSRSLSLPSHRPPPFPPLTSLFLALGVI